MIKIAIVGAGLAGSMIAGLLDKFPNFEITVYEKRPNPNQDDNSSGVFGHSTSAVKRSINLALSHRGILALKELGLADTVLETAIKMPRRVIHELDGTEIFQPYGRSEEETLYSISREYINNVLADYIQTNSKKVKILYGYTLQWVDKEGKCAFLTADGEWEQTVYDLVIGADGAYSAVRENMLKLGRIDFSRHYIPHGYKELTIPAIKRTNEAGEVVEDYALPHHEGLHIWPRGEFMLIALPNPDKSFTATLFAPYQGRGGFDSIDSNNPEQIIEHFQHYFPDVYPLMPELTKDYHDNVVGSLVTVRTNPWNVGKILLIGDAAHAVVPFFGQGMNCAFQDALVLYNTLRGYFDEIKPQQSLAKAVTEFAKERVLATNALADLSLAHYHDMASNTASYWYLFKKRVENGFSVLFPKVFQPLYQMVAFTSMPYHEAISRANQQEVWVERTLTVVGGSLLLAGGYLYLNGGEKSFFNRFSHLLKR